MLGTNPSDYRAQKFMLKDLQVAVSTTLIANGCSRLVVNARTRLRQQWKFYTLCHGEAYKLMCLRIMFRNNDISVE
jgi:hypothetical protein